MPQPIRSLADLFEGVPPRTVLHGIYETEGSPAIHGYEALMRGPSGLPFEGPVLAFAFAHAVDLLPQLDLACVGAALAAAPEGPRLYVNLHPITLAGQGTAAVLEQVRRSGRDPRRLVVEVVEHGPELEAGLVAAVAALRREGLGIAVDDFGEGASNLRRLLQLRPDYLKVDRWFVHGADRDPDRRAVLRALARMGTDLGMRVIAEGVRSAELLAAVRDCGITLVQCHGHVPAGIHDALAESAPPPRVALLERLEPLGIDAMTDRDLDALPFGVIQLARDGTILRYNRYEEDLARRRAAEVVGRNFFTEVAPCTDVRAFAGRFRDGVDAGELHVSFDYLFAFDPPRQVRVTLYYSAATGTGWVFVQE